MEIPLLMEYIGGKRKEGKDKAKLSPLDGAKEKLVGITLMGQSSIGLVTGASC